MDGPVRGESSDGRSGEWVRIEADVGCSSGIFRDDASDDELGLLSARNFSTTNRLTSSRSSLCTPAFQASFSLANLSRNFSFSFLISSRILSIHAIKPVSRTGGSGIGCRGCEGPAGGGLCRPERLIRIGRGERKGDGGAVADLGERGGERLGGDGGWSVIRLS